MTERSKGYFHSTMLMQALRKGFLRLSRKRDLAGRGFPPVACSFLSFSLCFLFSSSSFMMTGLAASVLDAILMPSPYTGSKFLWKLTFIVKSQTQVQYVSPLWKQILLRLPLAPSFFSSSSLLCRSHPGRATGLSAWLRASDKISPPRPGKTAGAQSDWRSSWPWYSLNLDYEPPAGHAWGWL